MTTPTHGVVGFSLIAVPLGAVGLAESMPWVAFSLAGISALLSMYQDLYGEYKRWEIVTSDLGLEWELKITRSKSWAWYVDAHFGKMYDWLIRNHVYQAWIHVKMDSLVHERAPFDKQTQGVKYWTYWTLMELIFLLTCFGLLRVTV